MRRHSGTLAEAGAEAAEPLHGALGTRWLGVAFMPSALWGDRGGERHPCRH